jgi:ubiquitin conjugation factor E4 B
MFIEFFHFSFPLFDRPASRNPIVEVIEGMGYHPYDAAVAVARTRNQNVENALTWLLHNMPIDHAPLAAAVTLRSHAHPIGAVTGMGAHRCDVCRGSIDAKGSYRCLCGCDYDVCTECFDALKGRRRSHDGTSSASHLAAAAAASSSSTSTAGSSSKSTSSSPSLGPAVSAAATAASLVAQHRHHPIVRSAVAIGISEFEAAYAAHRTQFRSLDAMLAWLDENADKVPVDPEVVRLSEAAAAGLSASQAAASSPSSVMDTTGSVAASAEAAEPPADQRYVPNFSTEIFFLAHEAVRLGFTALVRDWKAAHERVWRGFAELRDGEDPSLPLAEGAGRLHCIRAALVAPDLIFALAHFYEFTATWFLAKLNHAAPASASSPTFEAADAAELAAKRDRALVRLMPEHVVEDMVSFFDFVRYAPPDTLAGFRFPSLLSFAATCMQRRGATSVRRTDRGALQVDAVSIDGETPLTSTYARASLLEILVRLLPPRVDEDSSHSSSASHGVRGAFRIEHSNVLVTHESLPGDLFPALARLYADVEYTGRSSQYYEKWDSRRNVIELLDCLLEYGVYRSAWARVSSTSHGDEVSATAADMERFVMLIVSDASYSLDEAIKNLKRIHEWEGADSMGSDDRQEMRRAESECRFFADLAQRFFSVLAKIAAHFPATFGAPLLADTVACMLGLYIAQLCGPRVGELKVKQPDRVHWRMKDMVGHVLSMYAAACAASPAFQECVVNDKRSYSPELLTRTLALVSKYAMLTPAGIERLRHVAAALEQRAAAAAVAAAQGGSGGAEDDAPDEFVDPLTAALMRDPVRVPSGAVCDRVTIRRHLMNQPSCPFTRQPLTEADLVADAELKARIDEWLRQRGAAQ